MLAGPQNSLGTLLENSPLRPPGQPCAVFPHMAESSIAAKVQDAHSEARIQLCSPYSPVMLSFSRGPLYTEPGPLFVFRLLQLSCQEGGIDLVKNTASEPHESVGSIRPVSSGNRNQIRLLLNCYDPWPMANHGAATGWLAHMWFK